MVSDLKLMKLNYVSEVFQTFKEEIITDIT
jgi:hypothetical protein